MSSCLIVRTHFICSGGQNYKSGLVASRILYLLEDSRDFSVKKKGAGLIIILEISLYYTCSEVPYNICTF